MHFRKLYENFTLLCGPPKDFKTFIKPLRHLKEMWKWKFKFIFSRCPLSGREGLITYLRLMFPFYSNWTHQKSRVFVMFFGGVESRISHLQKFCKIDVKNVHRKTPVLQSLFNKSWSHLCWSLFIKKILQHRCLSVNNVEFFLFFMEHLWWFFLRKETLVWNRLIKSLNMEDNHVISCFQKELKYS